MILGNIIGKTTTLNFKFLVKGDAKKFQYIQVLTEDNKYILAQITELERDENQTIADCIIIGYRENNILKRLLKPLSPNTEVLLAEESLIKHTLGLKRETGSGYIGQLDNYNIKVHLDLNKVITKHLAILAKSGSGKTYCVSTILEELLERKVPMLIIDPHGEYSSLKHPNPKDKELLLEFNIKPKSYSSQIKEYTPLPEYNLEANPLKLSLNNTSPTELIHLLPAKLSNSQLAALYSALRNSNIINLDNLILELQTLDNPAKWTLISIIEHLKSLNIFSDYATPSSDLIRPNQLTIINLKGTPQDLQEIIVHKLLSDLFRERKLGNIPPFFLILEEAHNYSPERNFKEAKSSPIIRQLFAEGRKFGLGACLITQRPSRIDKSSLSQCTTQIILKVTNPNDIKSISNSVEGITQETEKEIRNIPIGTAMITGVVDLPIFVKIRPRRTKHGGEAVTIISEEQKENLLPIIDQKTSIKDLKLMHPEIKIKSGLVPCILYSTGEFNFLVNKVTSEIITNFETSRGTKIPELQNLSQSEQKVFEIALKLKEFTSSQLFSESQLQFSEIYDIIKQLTNKNIFKQNQNNFTFSKEYEVFQNINQYPCYEKLEYKNIETNKTFTENKTTDYFDNIFKKFIPITNKKDCFLVIYEVLGKQI